MSNDRILPSHFIGNWEIISDAEDPDVSPMSPITTEVDIEAQEPDGRAFPFRILEKSRGVGVGSFTTTYHQENDSLVSSERGLCISFWRHPSQDHIFATTLVDGSVARVWGARRKVLEELEPPDITDIVWKITARKGPHAAHGFVRLLKAHVREPRFESAAPRLYYLFHLDDEAGKGKVCYDIVKYSSRSESFDSIFRVRSLKFWNDDNGKKHLFAMFDDRFSLPAGHFGTRTPIASLMPFEERILRPGRRSPELEGEPDPGGDPDVGTWGGDPG